MSKETLNAAENSDEPEPLQLGELRSKKDIVADTSFAEGFSFSKPSLFSDAKTELRTEQTDEAEETVEAELIPLEEKGVNFSFTLSKTKLFGDKMDSNVITELKKVSNEAITEKDGIFMISENLDTRNVKLNDEFKGLVDSLL